MVIIDVSLWVSFGWVVILISYAVSRCFHPRLHIMWTRLTKKNKIFNEKSIFLSFCGCLEVCGNNIPGLRDDLAVFACWGEHVQAAESAQHAAPSAGTPHNLTDRANERVWQTEKKKEKLQRWHTLHTIFVLCPSFDPQSKQQF